MWCALKQRNMIITWCFLVKCSFPEEMYMSEIYWNDTVDLLSDVQIQNETTPVSGNKHILNTSQNKSSQTYEDDFRETTNIKCPMGECQKQNSRMSRIRQIQKKYRLTSEFINRDESIQSESSQEAEENPDNKPNNSFTESQQSVNSKSVILTSDVNNTGVFSHSNATLYDFPSISIHKDRYRCIPSEEIIYCDQIKSQPTTSKPCHSISKKADHHKLLKLPHSETLDRLNSEDDKRKSDDVNHTSTDVPDSKRYKVLTYRPSGEMLGGMRHGWRKLSDSEMMN